MTPRLVKSVEDMAGFCPDLVYQPDAITEGAWWSGEVCPLRTLDKLPELLDDIHHHRAVYTAWRGELRHLPRCDVLHDRHDWMERVRPEELTRSFTIRLYYAGGCEDPRCWAEGIDRANGLHMWDDNSICPFLSSKHAWDWTRDTVADFIGHVSVWLVCWMVFQQTGAWIVGEHGGTPGYHLANIRPNEHCWCRSGKKYRKCHMQGDQAAFFKFRR